MGFAGAMVALFAIAMYADGQQPPSNNATKPAPSVELEVGTKIPAFHSWRFATLTRYEKDFPEHLKISSMCANPAVSHCPKVCYAQNERGIVQLFLVVQITLIEGT